MNTATDTLSHLNIEERTRETLSLGWRAVFAGVFISMLTFLISMSLGLALSATSVRGLFVGLETVKSLGVSVGIWTMFSVLLSLFVGSYASGRARGIIATRIGYSQGAVVSALFFVLLMWQLVFAIGVVGRGINRFSGSTGSDISDMARNSRLSGVIEDTLSDLKFRDPPDTVIPGVAVRLMRGDQDSTVNYLATQASISADQARARLQTLNAKYQSLIADLGDMSFDIIRILGWSVFATAFFGTLAAMLGGGLGAQVNLRKPLGRMDRRALSVTVS
jgi:hypothetical protein